MYVMQVRRTFFSQISIMIRKTFELICAALLFFLSYQGLDFERSAKHTLLVAVENEVPFVTQLPTATATVVVMVQDVNEAPIFEPVEKVIAKAEDLPVDSDLVQYTASDPDTARKQKVM